MSSHSEDLLILEIAQCNRIACTGRSLKIVFILLFAIAQYFINTLLNLQDNSCPLNGRTDLRADKAYLKASYAPLRACYLAAVEPCRPRYSSYLQLRARSPPFWIIQRKSIHTKQRVTLSFIIKTP